MSEYHSNYRDEQFWFTAAVVAFNTVLIAKDAPAIPKSGRLAACLIISLLGAAIILTRWVAGARAHADAIRKNQQERGINSRPREEGRFKHFQVDAPNPEFACACERLRYFWAELRTGIQALFYIAAEGSGSLFYLLLIGLSCLAVILYA